MWADERFLAWVRLIRTHRALINGFYYFSIRNKLFLIEHHVTVD